MHSDSLLICSIGLLVIGIMLTRIAWTSLTFQENAENEYDFHDLAFYGGKFCALKNFFRGLASYFTGQHRVLRGPSALLVAGCACIVSALLVSKALQI